MNGKTFDCNNHTGSSKQITSYENNGIFLITGNAGLKSSTVLFLVAVASIGKTALIQARANMARVLDLGCQKNCRFKAGSRV